MLQGLKNIVICLATGLCFVVPLKSHTNTTRVFSEKQKEFLSKMDSGKELYQKYCAACHQANGEGQRLGAPALKKGLPNSSYITIDKPISENIDILLYGVEGTPMIGYKAILNNEELASVITYIRNAWGNDTGDVLHGEDILLRRAADPALLKEPVRLVKPVIPVTALMTEGKKIYRTYCARCHQLDGRGQAPFGPRLIGSYVAKDPILIPFKIDLLLEGAAGTRMRSYAKQLSDYELASVATYIANGLKNGANQQIQPQEIAQRRQNLPPFPTNSTPEQNLSESYEKLMQMGKILYMANCARCHQLDGQKGARPGIPSLTKSALIRRGSHIDHLKLVLVGVPGSIMRSFGNRLSDFEIAAILTYQRNTFGRHQRDLVQPSEVRKEREKLQSKIDYQNAYQLIQQDEQEKKRSDKKH